MKIIGYLFFEDEDGNIFPAEIDSSASEADSYEEAQSSLQSTKENCPNISGWLFTLK